MQNGNFREPIHINVATKGKIHKYCREIVMHHEPEIHSLIVTSKFSSDQKSTHYRIKQKSFFKKHDSTQRQKKNTSNELMPEIETGSFRAIHTAFPFDALKGFPLRSTIPVKPFRRGIRSSNIPLNKHLLLEDLQSERPNTEYNRGSHRSADLKPFTIQNVATFQSPEYVPKYNDIQNFEQFYMYKGSGHQQSLKVQEQNPKVSGTKIQPFKKYKIREILHKMSLPKHLKYQNPESLK